ncbi:Conserved_hypothetical protein [Hexamita inflata]|uniref:Uncharacterized protein n=1 Tax=Hexamita inflata TaxID=28002 RepID=A0AA86QFL5_9EUKA|nr:Conserved hypothetical protein [Hexamita inflata]
MGCGAVQDKQVEITTTDFEHDSPIECFQSRFHGFFHPELAAGLFFNYCFNLQAKQGEAPLNQGKLTNDSKFSLLPLEQEDNEIFKQIKRLKRDTISTMTMPSAINQSIDEHQTYLQDKYALIKEEELKQKQSGAVELPNEDDEPNLRLSVSSLPDMQVYKVDYSKFKASFNAIFELIKTDIPYLSEFDLYQVENYIKYDPTNVHHTPHLSNNFRTFMATSQPSANVYSMQSYLQLYYIFSPEQLVKVLRDPLYILFFYADELFNTYAECNVLLGLFQQHFPDLKVPIKKIFLKSCEENHIQLDEFETILLPKLKDELKKHQNDLKLNLNKPDLKQFVKADKNRTKQIYQEVSKSISKFMLDLDPNSKWMKRNESQAGLLNDDQIKEEQEMRKALGD